MSGRRGGLEPGSRENRGNKLKKKQPCGQVKKKRRLAYRGKPYQPESQYGRVSRKGNRKKKTKWLLGGGMKNRNGLKE